MTELYVLGNHNLNVTSTLELKNKIDKRLNNFSLINIEYLRELELQSLNDIYRGKNIGENENIKEKIIRMSINKNDNKVNIKKEFTESQKMEQLEIASKIFSYDMVNNNYEFESSHWYLGDEISHGSISIFGSLGLACNVFYNRIEFHNSIQYKNWLHLHRIIRDEWRKYYYQIIKMLGGDIAIYIPYYIMEIIWNNVELDKVDILNIKDFLIELFGENNKNITKVLDNEYCGYIIDDFSDINLDKNMNINDFKKYIKHL
jgi:hypothetical protein